MPYRLIYSSEATGDMPRPELERMLAQSRARNNMRDVTGVLVFVDGIFLQILEGDQNNVAELMEKIGRDPRHRAVKVFHEEDIEKRTFGSWRMAFVSPSAEEMAAWAGLDGATTIEETLATLRKDPGRIPRVVFALLEAVSEP
jgi:hypothetical protein